MSWNRRLRILAGSVIWLGGLVALTWWCRTAVSGADQPHVAQDLLEFASGRRQAFPWQAATPLPIAVGDPVFLVHGPDSIQRIGEVSRSAGNATSPVAEGDVVFYSSAPAIPAGARLTYHETPRSMQWVIETMLPPHKRREISQQLQATFQQHQAEILEAVRPVVEAALRDALPVVEQDLAEALARHSDELQRLGGKYQQEIVERELIPLVKQEVWPIVVRHAEPTVTEVGREIWQEASVWRFGWRYAYDLSPLPEKRLLEGEWNRFVRDDAAPILASHVDDFVRVQQRILADLAKNPQVQAAMRRSLEHLLQDPELQAVVTRIFREVLVDNPRLQQVLREHWESERARRAVQLASSRMEPTVVRIGQLLLGTPEQGITPEFAQVLRNQILKKDRCWLVLELPAESSKPSPGGSPRARVLPVKTGTGSRIHPFVVPSRSNDSLVVDGDPT